MSVNPSSTVHGSDPIDPTWTNDPLNHIVRAFITFLQTVFEKAPQGFFHWSPQLEETEIAITEDSPVNLDSVEQKPCISIVLGPTRFNGSSLDDLVNVDIRDAKEIHTDLLPGTMTLNCMSRVPTEARFLGWQCARHIWILRKIFIAETYIHDMGRNITVGSVTPAGELVQGDTEHEWCVAPVSVPFFMQWTDSVTPLETDWNGRPIHRLNEISMLLRTRMNAAQANLTHSQEAGLQQWGSQAAGFRSNQRIARQRVLKPASIRGRRIQTVPVTTESLDSEHKV